MSGAALDAAKAVRPGEELDPAALQAYLQARLPELAGPVGVQQFPRGHSNLTYLLTVGDRELVLRRPPHGAKAIKSGHDMGREYRMLAGLQPVYARVPRVLHFCPEEGSPLGVPFYLMERVQGVILRTRPPEGVELTPGVMRSISEAFVDNLVALHAVDYQAAGLAELGKPRGYLARQVEGWIERYRKSKTDDLPDMEKLAAWLPAHRPPDAPGAVIHNDYKYDNLVLDPADLAQIRAVLDWEMATLGDPLSDLGTSLAYWFEAGEVEGLGQLGLGLTALPGNLTREGLLQRYALKSGREVGDMVFYYANALFKVAVIAQQIYFRYQQGFTRDERFAGMIFAVGMLAQVGVRAVETGRISALLG